ncbi:MAG: hypothetical protein VW646_01805 [Hydrogenophilales bacterium]
MNEEIFEEIIQKLENKHKDCISFSKKYQTREMDDLYQYYEGAKWAIDYALTVVSELKEK